MTTTEGSMIEGADGLASPSVSVVPWALILRVESDERARNGSWLRRLSELTEIIT